MTQTQARDRVRRLVDQTDTSNTQFSDSFIDDMVEHARRFYATILPEKRLLNLHAGDTGTIAIASSFAAYPSDFLKRLKQKQVEVDGTFADEIKDSELWRLKELETSAFTDPSFGKYYRETGNGIETYPDGSFLKYPYIKIPAALNGTDNTDLTDDVEDLTILHAVERMLHTQRGDFEIAQVMLQERQANFQLVARNT